MSIGAARLPDDLDTAVAILRRAIDGGCNYIDTARGYTDCETKVGQALRDGYRYELLDLGIPPCAVGKRGASPAWCEMIAERVKRPLLLTLHGQVW